MHNPYVEAEALRDLLAEAGVPAGAITLEPLAEHTDENLYYSSVLMVGLGFDSAMVVSDPEHLMYTATCDANCCVDLGRLTPLAFPTATGTAKVGSYILTPPSLDVTAAECRQLERTTLFLCTQLDSRLACADDFGL